MAWHLYRLGRWSFVNRRIVAATWAVLLVLTGVGASTLAGTTSDEFSLPGIESIEAFELIEERTPEAAPDGATARIAFQAPEGEVLTSDANRDLVLRTIDATVTDAVLATTDPFETGAVSEDERTAYATVSYSEAGHLLDEADRDALRSAPEDAKAAGLTVAIGGDALMEMPETASSELLGILVAIVVLVITFGSLLAAGLPLLTAIIGVGIGIGGITIATGLTTLGSTTPILATMLGLAVGIDYALFIVSRYRHEVAAGWPLEEAAGRAVGTAGSAVVFAGLTVVIALAGLSVVQISFLTEMGLAAAGTVAVAVVIALTLLPALAGFTGRRIVTSRLPFLGQRHADRTVPGRTFGRRWADTVTRRKAPVFVLGLVVAAVLSIPIASMTLAIPDEGTAPRGSDSRIAYDLISESFGPGANGPLLVVVDTAGIPDLAAARAAVDEVVEAVQSVDEGVAAVIPPVTDDSPAEQVEAYEQQLGDAEYTSITVLPETGPSDAATQDLVHRLRDTLHAAEPSAGVDVLTTGMTAVGVDVSEELAAAFPRYLATVVGLAFVLLVLVFRSVLVPLKAVVGFLLTIGISLGVTVAVFQWGWLKDLVGVDTPGPVLFMLPLLLTGILFGLAMDYEVFLVSRMREEYVHGQPAQQSVVLGFQYGARVVTAAAAIMIGVFGSFALGDDAMVKSIGFALAVGILADAFLVRMTIVPAALALLGDRAWWLPRWLDRVVPNLDIEGESLAKKLGPARPVPAPEPAPVD